jgi:branched-subunit amino acid transport protein
MEITSMNFSMDALWVGLIATSVIAFLLKYLGHNVPEKWLSHPRVLKINALIPIALLSALVAVQTFTNGKELVIDQRLAGLAVAVIALILRAPFALVVISAAATSAALYHLQ